MPSKSEKQHRLMEAAAHNKEFADKVGIDQKTAREFLEADKRRDEELSHKHSKKKSKKK